MSFPLKHLSDDADSSPRRFNCDDVDEQNTLITREELDALKAGMWREIHRRQKRSARIRQGVRPVLAAIVGAIAFVALSNDGGCVRRMDPDPLLGGGEDVFSGTDSLMFLVQPDSTVTRKPMAR